MSTAVPRQSPSIATCELNGAQNKFIAALLVDGTRLEDVRESQKEVAARLGVTKGTVRDWLRSGWLRRSGKGVTSGAVARFLQEHPEAIQYGALRPHFKEWVKRLGYRAQAKADETGRESVESPVSAYSAAAGSM